MVERYLSLCYQVAFPEEVISTLEAETSASGELSVFQE
jgi:hypothetical protein